jgi:transcriptional regulator with XRE-family HTH domain
VKIPRTDAEIAFARLQGRMIFALRSGQGISRKQLADDAHLTYSSVYRIENGDLTGGAFDLAMICAVLEVSVSDVFPEAPRMPTSHNLLSLAGRCRPQRVFA